MKAITLHQPWATWIAWGWKTIETRTHRRFKSLVGERIAIHAGKTWDGNAGTAARPYLVVYKPNPGEVSPYHRRGWILCTAMVTEHRALDRDDSKAALVNCGRLLGLRFGLFLSDVRPLADPIPCIGHQGIWTVPDDVLADMATLAAFTNLRKSARAAIEANRQTAGGGHG